jgi:hypothetical protein
LLFRSLLGLTVLGLSPAAFADSGFYVGGSIGSGTISADVEDPSQGPDFNFDENDFAWKAYGGYNFDLAVIDLGIEGGYVDLGSPSGTFLGQNVEISATGWDAFALAGIELGPVGVFVKAGVISWDADFVADVPQVGRISDSDDGSDPAYGAGVRFSLGSFEIRGEYELFDIDGSDDVYLLSVGLVWTF